MSDWAPLVSLFAVGTAAAITPGPTFVTVSRIAVERSRMEALLAVAGAATSGVLWAGATILGLSAVFALWPWLETALRIAGGLYLIRLGILFWRSPKGGAEGEPPAPGGNAYLCGLTTDLLNPKCLAFFASVFALFIRPEAPDWIRIGAVATVATVSLAVYGTVALMFSTGAARRAYLALRGTIERVSGTVMLGFGLRLLLPGG
ncbi:MAG TPA: LysE family transporter [Stellaceae bacterium]|nr:LysE family transporter [Stellaceae bacterium]